MEIGGSHPDDKNQDVAMVGHPESEKLKDRWRLRDALAAALLFVATAGFVLWQNSRVAVLWDLGYLLDTSWRIALGQMPYRDFPLAHAPLTFLVQAGLMRLGGRHYVLQMVWAALAGGVATVLAWRILLRVMRGAEAFGRARWLVAIVMALPLVTLGIYSVYPYPIYDCDAVLAVLVALLLLVRSGDPGREEAKAKLEECAAVAPLNSCPVAKQLVAVAAGATTVLPLFFKQNIGLPFVAVVATGMLVLLAWDFRRARSFRAMIESPSFYVFAGIAFTLLAGVGIIAATAGLGNYVHWTIRFAAQRRLPGLAAMLSVYDQPSLLWMAPALAAGILLCHMRFIARWWTRIAAFCFIGAPFAGTLILFLMDDDADERADILLALWPVLLVTSAGMALVELRRGITLPRLIPLFLLAAIHGTFLSQQLWGSSYALWPLLIVLVAYVLVALPASARPVAIAGAVLISATFLVCGTLYSASLERLSYVRIPDGPVERSIIPALRGMGTPGAFLPDFDELVEFAAREIPPGDALILLPGEDPFFYATGRAPRFPVTLFDPATDPYSASGLMDEARRRNVRWVIVKRTLQMDENPMPERERSIELIQRSFTLYGRLRGYDVYRRE